MNATEKVRIGTRGSPLALAQAHEVRARLAASCPSLAASGAVDVVVIRTTGDAIQDRPLSEIGGKGLFTRELDEAMLRGDIDLAVHSMKDVPTVLPDGIDLPCMLEREDPRDAFLSLRASCLADLPSGSVVGTASLRRQAQILARFPHLRVQILRGNVQTRMQRLEEGVVDATLLALAGLRRLGLDNRATSVLDADEMLPAVAQGAIGITCRASHRAMYDILQPLSHLPTMIRVSCERSFLQILDGSCRTPIAGLAELIEDGTRLFLRGFVANPDGSGVRAGVRTGLAEDAIRLGRELAMELAASPRGTTYGMGG
ncbi:MULTISPECIES: hydroxymethylbilane synthase [unclassified Haematospirillum]|uniref:hydroxymethylbilane synthase n=1 Tax=unclassified Haematospirillum TaxID=2622088 RepID=UPI001438EEEC|nr:MULTISPECIES: hydroxymethylbilane synthase [unclassified Haematospirillum]NKD55056.1 hydroxymethylbilane synthase [Haematospirillum sp. H4890]NKD75309.1 hydroxymethylbilane synthase [Haematospirillum sp. H4485]NKD87583.1 hydroxymethylbilane synthase [Haematospirillum sp. 15-248]